MTPSAKKQKAAPAPPLTPGTCATLACLWEATAAKPGNVYRGADFDDVTYADFLTSAAVVGPILDNVAAHGVGASLLRAVQATRAAVATNTNLGMLLLLTPLAAAPWDVPLAEGICSVLRTLTNEDTQAVYEAIRVAQPGGLGETPKADVQSVSPPEVSLVEAMQLAADRDQVARQFTNNFQQVFWVADQIEQQLKQGQALGEAIVCTFVKVLSEFPDSLIARKCGSDFSREVSARAAVVLASGVPGEAAYHSACQELDFWLRADGHRRNPGTTADFIAAGLFVLLRDQRFDWPSDFYGRQ